MPLVRKPTDHAEAPKTDAHDVLESLASADADVRWTAARDAANVPGGGPVLAAALRIEDDPRVREAMFTALARIATPDAVDAVVALLRSDDANLRAGALDTLRIMVIQAQQILPRLLRDNDVDVRILSCELARSLGSTKAARLMCGLLDIETEVNVCAAAVDVLAEVGGAEALPSLRNCALKFRESAFLSFAINTVINRLAAQSSPPRA